MLDTEMMDHLALPGSSKTVVAASSATTIAVPQISINRMAYSLSSFNQQFRRLSQMSDRARARKEMLFRSFRTSDPPKPRRFCAWARQKGKNIADFVDGCLPSFDFCAVTCTSLTPFSLCKRYFPAFEWLSEYQKVDLISDILAGLTIAVFHVPECMGYSFLADVNPIYCLYSSFFPTLIYGLMGTSQYCSVGTFAALSIMTGTVIKDTKLALHREAMLQHSVLIENSGIFGNFTDSDTESLTSNATADHLVDPLLMVTFQNEDIAFGCTFLVGFYLLIFGILRLGFISVYMSEQFLNGFTCSVAYHVLASQIPNMLGLPRADTESGEFILFQYLTHIYQYFDQINVASFAITILTSGLILTSKFYFDPWLVRHKQLKISFPIEFIVVIFGVVMSRCFNLSSSWNVQIIGSIQSGLPEPIMPSVRPLLKHLWQPCISIAVVSYSITYSVGRTFYDQMYDNPKGSVPSEQEEHETKTRQQSLESRSWEINPSQELVALGCSNFFSSFFSCIPAGASLSRSAIQFGSGGKTQLVSLINSVGILVILYMSSVFETLPKAILATIISVALRDLLGNVSQFRKYWQISKVDASVWLVTFLSVMIIDINYGIFLGLLYSLITLIYKSQLPPAYLLGSVCQLDEMSSVDFFVPLDQYINARELPGIKIFQFCGPLHFANVDYFFKQLEAKLKISLKDLMKIKTIEINLSNALEWNLASTIQTIPLTPGELSQSVSDDMLLDEDDDDEGDLLLGHYCSTSGPFCSTLSLTMLPVGSSLHQKTDPRTIELIIRRCRRHLRRLLPSYLVIDCSMFSYVDTDGLKMLKRLVKDFDFLDVKVFLGGCPSHVGRLLERSELEQSHECGQVIYISVPDAIEHARQEQQDIARTRSIMALNGEVSASCLAVNDPDGRLDVLEPFSSYSTLRLDDHHQFQYPKLLDSWVFTSTTEPLSSLFSSVASPTRSLAGDSVVQQLSVPTVIELSPDDCTTLSIEEEVSGGGYNDQESAGDGQQIQGKVMRLAYSEV